MTRDEAARALEELASAPAATWIGNRLGGGVLLQKYTRCGAEETLTPEEAITKVLGLSHGSAPVAHATKKRAKSYDTITESDYRAAAKFEMKRFGLTLSETLKLAKDKRYPAILKTLEDWRALHGWPAASSPLSRGYVFDLIGMQRSK